jgi:hypothetical protein
MTTRNSSVVLRCLVVLGPAVFCWGPGVTAQQQPLPPGAISIINEDRLGSRVAICVETGEKPVQQGARKVLPTAVWVGQPTNLHKVNAGLGACDPAWSPNGRLVAVTAVEGLWLFTPDSTEGSLRVESRLPIGESSEFTYRAFSQPEWSPDGALVALVVTNGGTSWVEVFEMVTGKLFYTSPPENYSFSWGDTARNLKLGDLEINLPAR